MTECRSGDILRYVRCLCPPGGGPTSRRGGAWTTRIMGAMTAARCATPPTGLTPNGRYRAADPARQARRQQAYRRRARGGQRADVRPQHRLRVGGRCPGTCPRAAQCGTTSGAGMTTARTLPQAGQRFGMPQLFGPCLPALGIRPLDGKKALLDHATVPDGQLCIKLPCEMGV